jgi:NAD+ kinase
MPTVHHVLIAVKTGAAAAEHDSLLLRARLGELGIVASCVRADAADELVRSAEDEPDGVVVVLGGDGTMVGVLRALVERGLAHTPVLGVNYGRVGFLTEMQRGDLDGVVSMLAQGAYTAYPRTALQWEVCRRGERLCRGVAVNDATLARRTTLARVCTLGIGVDGVEIGTFRADGVIVSAPAGTSGYAYSAGGSLVHPSLQAVSVTAVSPFLSHFPNMVLPPDKVVEISVLPASVETCLTIDGQNGVELEGGDTVLVRGMPDAFSMIVPDRSSYFCRLRRCGFTFEPAECGR